MKPKSVAFDTRYGGWCYLNQSNEWCGCPPPFRTHKQAIDYALARLRADGDSPYGVIVDARAALEWAAALDRSSLTTAADAKRTCKQSLQVAAPPEGRRA